MRKLPIQEVLPARYFVDHIPGTELDQDGKPVDGHRAAIGQQPSGSRHTETSQNSSRGGGTSTETNTATTITAMTTATAEAAEAERQAQLAMLAELEISPTMLEAGAEHAKTLRKALKAAMKEDAERVKMEEEAAKGKGKKGKKGKKSKK